MADQLIKNKKKLVVTNLITADNVPKWEGGQFLASRPFIDAFTSLRIRDTTYIKTSDIQEFLNILFADVNVEEVDVLALKDFVQTYNSHFEVLRQRWTSMIDLHEFLEPMFVDNFMKQFHGRLKYSSVDIMMIWTFYNADDSMSLDSRQAMTFVYDLLQTTKHRCNPRIIQTIIDKLILLSEDKDEITLRGLTKLLPLEVSIMKQYENIQELDEASTDRILAFYDQDDEGEISGCELYALIKDVLEANGQEDPYNMEVILQAVEYLKQEGGVSPLGNLDKNYLNILFSLGLNQTSL